MPLPIIGVGHSIRAAQLVHLSLMNPSLFHSLVLVEPYILSNSEQRAGQAFILVSLRRRDLWPSQEAAAAAFKKGLKSWDARVMDLYIQHGLSEATSDGQH